MRIIALAFAIFSFLLSGCDRDDTELTAPLVDGNTTPDEFLQFVNTFGDPAANQSRIDNVEYAEAYYRTVDPNNLGDTLSNWQANNNFDPATATHATFRDAKDLGYGRDMYAWKNGDNTYVFVNNYVVELQPGDATQYGPLNLDAAIAKDPKYLIGTNAIEFSPVDVNANEGEKGAKKIVKFFIFAPHDANGVQKRVTSADLDGRGVKYMPTMCTGCHGATMYPLTASGEFNSISLKSSNMHILEKDALEFSTQAGFTAADQEEPIKQINKMIFDSYVESGMRQDSNANDDRANWDSTFAEELLKIAYGDSPGVEDMLVQSTDYQAKVPKGWKNTVPPTAPKEDRELLYKKVIAPHCIGCHSLRGTQVAGTANAINFSTYDEFMKYADQTARYVYHYARMPSSLINYTRFWENPDDGPTLLAHHLEANGEDISILDSSGKIQRPGRPVAVPGFRRELATDMTIQDATASKFTTAYQWEVVEGAATLDDYNSPAPLVSATTATQESKVKLKLTTSNAQATGDPKTVELVFTSNSDPLLAAPTFVDNILSDTAVDPVEPPRAFNGCTGCHNSGPGFDGIPIYFDVTDYPGNEKDLYRNVMNLVNQADPENSQLLRKPTGEAPHRGGIPFKDSEGGYTVEYNTLLNWIRAGAPCGAINEDNTAKYCPADAACIDGNNSNMITSCGP